MTQGFYEILSNVTIAKDIYEMVLGGDTSAITAPGQFINIKVEGFYLRRPISICDWDEKTITILFKTVGEGTQRLSEMKVGEKLDILV
jgi:dihydroorotate dehydrogenase electron transfer subunit